jgi:anti-anti-sigma factor
MIPPGMELRPALTVQSDTLGFGYAGEHVPDAVAITGLSALIDYVETMAPASTPRRVLVDMRNVEGLSTAALGKLLAINHRLRQVDWRLVLIIDDPLVREVLTATGLNQVLQVTSSAVLGLSARQSPADDFTEAELQSMISSGLTLDQAIREIERLRE